ncbi:hypothetical protein [Geobacillus zalihae]|uniref:hypothetical protein n=1 Tax=Geobacillus zalihae TaxID=213419 RepID=UPI001F6079BF|nr:hypothetical protein [Geobacillus zalihae]
MKQTIAHFLHEKMKINQRFIYNQMVHLKKYRPIMIGSFADDGIHPFPLINYYRLNDIDDFGRFAKEQNIVAIHAHHGKHAAALHRPSHSACRQHPRPRWIGEASKFAAQSKTVPFAQTAWGALSSCLPLPCQ